VGWRVFEGASFTGVPASGAAILATGWEPVWARWIMIQGKGPNPYLELAEVRTFGWDTNVAVSKQAHQSTDPFGAPATRATDGNTDGFYSHWSVTHTDWGFRNTVPSSPGQWWYVDLQQRRRVRAVKIFNRTDCCSERLSHYNLHAWDPINSRWNVISDHSADDTTGVYEITIPTPSDLLTQYVMVAKTDDNYLSLAEVQVMGY